MTAIAGQAGSELFHILVKEHRFLGYGLVWAGAMLGILAWWIRVKFDDFPPAGTIVLALAALAPALLGLVRIIRRRIPGNNVDEQCQFLLKQRRLLAFSLLSGGSLLILLGLVIGLPDWPARVGELLNVAALGLLAIWAGFRQWHIPQTAGVRDTFLQQLGRYRLVMFVGLLLFAIVCLGGAIWVARTNWTDNRAATFPLWGGGFILGFLFLGAAFWFRTAGWSDIPPLHARVFILMLGGVTGLVLAVLAFVQAWLWADFIFFGGINIWTGPQSWRLWTCIYLELLGLALMLGSSFIVQVDIRQQPVLRRILFGYQTVLNGLLLLAFLVVLNIVVYAAAPFNFDWSAGSRGFHALSPSSKNLLQSLKEPTTVYVLMSPRLQPYQDIRNLLDNAQIVSDRLKSVYIVPEVNLAEYQALAVRYPELIPSALQAQAEDEVGRGLLLVYGSEEGKNKPPHKLITPRKIVEDKFDHATGERKLLFHGEEALMTELKFLAENQKKTKILMLQGDGELDVSGRKLAQSRGLRLPLDQMGGSKLFDRLQKENYDVKGLSFLPPEEGKSDPNVIYLGNQKDPEIPADTSILMAMGVSKPMPKRTLEAIERYLDKGGRLIAAFDVVVDAAGEGIVQTGLEGILKKYNVDVTSEYIVRLIEPDVRDFLAVRALAWPEAKTSLAQQFTAELAFFRTARVIKPIPAKFGKFQVEPFLVVPRGDRIWSESGFDLLRDPLTYMQNMYLTQRHRIGQANLPVAVTVSEGQDKGRMVVFGDGEFADNFHLTPGLGGQPDLAFNLIANSVDWLAERPGLGIRPKESGFFTLNKNIEQRPIVLLPGLVMLVGIVGLGVGVWVVRRH